MVMVKTMMRIPARIVAVVALLLMTLSPALASADEKSEAQERFKKGVELYEEENFTAALVEFRKAYDLVPAYQVLFNIARTCYQMRDYVCALKTYDRYLVEGGAGVDATRKEEVEKEIAIVKKRIGTLNITASKGATITVDGVKYGDAPLSAPVQVSEGKRLVRATLAGHETAEKNLDVSGGDTLNVDLSSRAGDSSSTTLPPSEGAKSSTPWWLWATTGVLAVGAGVTGAIALSASSEADDIRTKGGTVKDYEDAESRMRTMSIVTDVLGIAAIATGVTALILTLSSGPPKSTGTTSKPSTAGFGGKKPGGLVFSF
jgi:hypothetical protein